MSSNPHFRLKLTVIALTLLYSGLSEAAISNGHNNVLFPLYPRLNLYGGTGDTSYGRADVMVPLFGSTQAIVYTDVNGQIGEDDSWLGSLGLGTRDAINNDFMLGGYVFADRFNSGDDNGGNNWLVFNPGVEFMTNHWDGRINGYIPSGKRKKLIGTFFGDQVNQSSAITHSGHQEFIRHDQFNVLFDKVEEIGPGADIDFGYTFTSLKRLRVNAGTYYFNMSDSSDINGVEAGIEMPINNHLLLQFNDSYDNVQKNTAVVSVRFTLGGMDKSCPTPTVQDRMLDPIYRHLGSLGNNAASPVNTRTINTHRIALERNNIWFFNANGNTEFNASAGDTICTFEHPCSSADFNQTNINEINNTTKNVNFYLAPGDYNKLSENNRLSLNFGQSIYGRSSDYKMPASKDSGFPLLTGGLDPKGDNTLDSFALTNNSGAQTIGINALNANNVSMNNLEIGGTGSTQNYVFDVNLDNAKNITLSNSTLNGTQTGVNAINASTVVINGNAITVKSPDCDEDCSLLASSGVTADSRSTAAINDNNITVSSGESEQGATAGIIANEGSAITASGNTIMVTANRPQAAAYGIFENNSSAAIITNNTITATGPHSSAYGIFGIAAKGGSTGTITYNTITVSSGNAQREGVVGIDALSSSLNIDHNIFSLTRTNRKTPDRNTDSVIGILARGTAVITSADNTFTITSASTFRNVGLDARGSSSINSSNDNFTLNNFENLAARGIGISTSPQSKITVNGDIFNLNMTDSIGILNNGVVTGSDNTFNFNGTGTKNCGDYAFFSGNGNTFTGTGVIC